MRLFVTGPTGSGKSTLAALLARRASLPVFPLDDIHWVRNACGDKRRDPAERLSLLQRIVEQDRWIVEGVQFKWADPALDRADRIVILDLPRRRTCLRIVRRFNMRRRSSAPASDHRGTLKALMEEMRWCADYYDHERSLLFEKTARWPDKLIVVRSHRDERALAEAVFTAG